ncbi:transmembrane protein 176A-like [Sphaerodactylus townsendi]|uniref:transmembrane protein 176A-like n=1 Tax=Sphaerodactylus townsendi TaxID=933632 RepID=UPI00202709FA|nr:transmembrane protein 176A-like [Sphaerodactylus townsendi]
MHRIPVLHTQISSTENECQGPPRGVFGCSWAAGKMATSLVKVNGTEVSVEDSGKTVVNINITQESWLSYLVGAVSEASQKWKAGRKKWKEVESGKKEPAPETPKFPPGSPAKAKCTGEQKVLGGVQILLGITCLGLGGLLCVMSDYVPAIGSGAPFWMGGLFVVSGSGSVLSERRRGCCWVLLAAFFNLTSVVAACVGLALGAADVRYLTYTPYWVDQLCERGDRDLSWMATQIPSHDWREDQCKYKMESMLKIVGGVQVLLLIFSVAALCVALFCFGYGLRRLCCRWRAASEDYVAIRDPEVPPPYEEPAKEEVAA